MIFLFNLRYIHIKKLWLFTIIFAIRLFGYLAIWYGESIFLQDIRLPVRERVDDLVSRLTLEEIVPQTLAVYGSHTPAIDRLGIKPYVWITECLHGQVHTNATAFPQSIGMAASFRYTFI